MNGSLPKTNLYNLILVEKNSELIFDVEIQNNDLFIHGYDRYTGRSVSALLNVISVKLIYNSVEVDITSLIHKSPHNKIKFKSLFPEGNNNDSAQIKITTGDLESMSCTQLIFGKK